MTNLIEIYSILKCFLFKMLNTKISILSSWRPLFFLKNNSFSSNGRPTRLLDKLFHMIFMVRVWFLIDDANLLTSKNKPIEN